MMPVALWRPFRGTWLEVVALVSGVILWEALGWILAMPWLPPFSKIVGALIQFVQSGVILGNVASSLQGLAIGFTISLFAGLLVGGLMGRYRRVEKAPGIFFYSLFILSCTLFPATSFSVFR